MKVNIIKASVLLALAGLTLPSCHDRDIKDGGELIEQNATFYGLKNDVEQRANICNPNVTELEEAKKDDVVKSFRVKFAKPLAYDTKIGFALSSEGVAEYNQKHKTAYEALPAELVVLPEAITLKKGEIKTPDLSLSVKITDAIKLNKTYIFVVQLKDVIGVQIFPDNTRLVYTLVRNEESTELKKSIELTRDVYLSSNKLDKDLNAKYRSTSFTVETFVNVQKFRGPGDNGDAGISTLFGVEGKTLFRFGDAGVPPNVLQAAGHKIGEFVFGTNKWYHVAISFDKGTHIMKVYVNGKMVREQDMVQASLNCDPTEGNRGWYIGRSYNGNRGIPARLAETRIWTKVRSLSEIKASMFGVDPKTEGLIAYWQMNKAKGENEVADVTGHGYDMVLKTQGPRKPAPVKIINEKEAISID